MSKTQLQTNNTRLASLITELRGKAAGGGGGGGSAAPDTCRLVVNQNRYDGYGMILSMAVLCYENGNYVMKTGARTLLSATVGEIATNEESIFLENVVCGSAIQVVCYCNNNNMSKEYIYLEPRENGDFITSSISNNIRTGLLNVTAEANYTAILDITFLEM